MVDFKAALWLARHLVVIRHPVGRHEPSNIVSVNSRITANHRPPKGLNLNLLYDSAVVARHFYRPWPGEMRPHVTVRGTHRHSDHGRRELGEDRRCLPECRQR